MKYLYNPWFFTCAFNLFSRPWMQPGVGGRGGVAHTGGTGDDEAPKDPGVRITHQSYTEKDYEGIDI